MHLGTYKLLALVLLLAVGMGCSSGTTNNAGGGGDASLVGTWNLVGSGGGSFPQHIVFNSNGTGAYSGGINSSFNWTQTGNSVTISTGSAQSAFINNLSSPVGNTFTLNSLGGSATYSRG